MATIGGAKATLVNKIDSLTASATAKDTIYLAKALKENTNHHSFTFQGAWAASTAYALDDVVTNGGNTYICIAAHTSGASFSVGSNWTMMASAGTDGTTVGTGTTDQVLTTNSSGALAWADAAGGGLSSIQSFISSGSYTWTKPAGVNKIKVIVTGGGGGGVGGVSNDNGGAGGGAGGTAIKVIDVSSVSTVAVTVGAGGPGAGTTGTGGNGGTTSFGSYLSATGGLGGRNSNNDRRYGGRGGLGAGGNINLYGGSGVAGSYGATNPSGVGGAASYWGAAGGDYGQDIGDGYTVPYINGQHGSGGGEHRESGGGDGGQGVVYIEEY